ncbi:MAG: toxin-antitoxin system HicB family antitoxin [Actinomycetota bacterium]|nr:toxin-antitoxin system HicB family antitoxin [Actinomycetota bacterium]
MRLQPHVEALERELADLGSLGEQAVATAAQRLIQRLATPVRVRLLELVGEAALEVSGQLPSGHIDVRLAGPDPSLVFVPEEGEEPPSVAAGADDSAARLTLRMPEALKASVEEAAAREGLSVNAWLVRAVARQLSEPRRPHRQIGKRITGFGRS